MPLIMLLEKEADSLLSICLLLKMQGFAVLTVCGIEEIFQADMLITDKPSVFNFLQEKTNGLPLLLIDNRVNENTNNHEGRPGLAVLEKPVDPSELLNTVKTLVDLDKA